MEEVTLNQLLHLGMEIDGRKTWSVLFSWPHIGRGGLSHRSCSRITQITSRLAAHLLPSSLLRAADASVYSLTNASPVSAP